MPDNVDNTDNVKETIEFEPVLKTDLIESQLEVIRDKINNVFQSMSIGPAGELPSSLSSDYNGIMGGYSQFQAQASDLVKTSQRVINAFATAPDTIAQGVVNSTTISGGTSIFSPLGAGYDYRSPQYRTDYLSKSSDILKDSFRENVSSIGSMAASFGAASMITKMLGATTMFNPYAIVGSMAFDAVLGAGIEKGKAKHRMSTGFEDMARDNGLGISSDSADMLTSRIYNYADSYKAISRDVSLEEISGNIQTFNKAGGFKNIKSVSEFKDSIDSVINDTREISKALGIFQEQAVNMMAELRNSGLAKTSQAKDFLYELNNNAMEGDTNISSMFNSGMASVNMMKGSYFGTKNAFNLGIDARISMSRLATDDPYIISRLGGAEKAAEQLTHNLIQGANKLGTYQMYGAIASGGTTPISSENIITGVTDFFSQRGMQGVLAEKGRETAFYGTKSAQQLAIESVKRSMSIMDDYEIGYKGDYGNAALVGMIMTQQNISRDAATAIVKTALYEPSYDTGNTELIKQMKSDEPGIFGVISSGISTAWHGATNAFTSPGEEFYKGTSSFAEDLQNIGNYAVGITTLRRKYIHDETYDAFKSGVIDKITKQVDNSKEVVVAKEKYLKAAGGMGDYLDLNSYNNPNEVSDITSNRTAELWGYGTDNRETFINNSLDGLTSAQDITKELANKLNLNISNLGDKQVITNIINTTPELRDKIKNDEEMKKLAKAKEIYEKTRNTKLNKALTDTPKSIRDLIANPETFINDLEIKNKNSSTNPHNDLLIAKLRVGIKKGLIGSDLKAFLANRGVSVDDPIYAKIDSELKNTIPSGDLQEYYYNRDITDIMNFLPKGDYKKYSKYEISRVILNNELQSGENFSVSKDAVVKMQEDIAANNYKAVDDLRNATKFNAVVKRMKIDLAVDDNMQFKKISEPSAFFMTNKTSEVLSNVVNAKLSNIISPEAGMKISEAKDWDKFA